MNESAWCMFRRLYKEYSYSFILLLNKKRGKLKNIATESTRQLIMYKAEPEAIAIMQEMIAQKIEMTELAERAVKEAV